VWLSHYEPGELFLDWIIGPVGSGKTTGIFFKLAFMAGLQAKSPDRRHPALALRDRAQHRAAAERHDDQVLELLVQGRQAGKWKATTKDFILRYGDVECEVLFRPLDTADDVQRVLSLEVSFAILDEFVQMPQAIVEALSARCGRYPPKVDGGCTNWGMWGASNPGMETDWWYPMLEDARSCPRGIAPAAQGRRRHARQLDLLQAALGLFRARRETWPTCPAADYYTNLAKGKTKHWIKQFIEVVWGYSMDGKPVFPMFNAGHPRLQDAAAPTARAPGDRLRPRLAGSGAVLMQYDEQLRPVMVLRELVQPEGYATDRFISEKLKPMLRSQFPATRCWWCRPGQRAAIQRQNGLQRSRSSRRPRSRSRPTGTTKSRAGSSRRSIT
jgi:hypothetical protein